jgi:hypothetical protein
MMHTTSSLTQYTLCSIQRWIYSVSLIMTDPKFSKSLGFLVLMFYIQIWLRLLEKCVFLPIWEGKLCYYIKIKVTRELLVTEKLLRLLLIERFPNLSPSRGCNFQYLVWESHCSKDTKHINFTARIKTWKKSLELCKQFILAFITFIQMQKH